MEPQRCEGAPAEALSCAVCRWPSTASGCTGAAIPSFNWHLFQILFAEEICTVLRFTLPPDACLKVPFDAVLENAAKIAWMLLWRLCCLLLYCHILALPVQSDLNQCPARVFRHHSMVEKPSIDSATVISQPSMDSVTLSQWYR